MPALSRSVFFFEDAGFADTTGDDEPGDEAVIVQTIWPLPAGSGLLLTAGTALLQLLQRVRRRR